MTDYKLVPVEKLKEWEATINTIALQTAFDIADDIAQYSYAPAVQEESVKYHPCTYILIEGLKRLQGGSAILAEWDRARSKVDAPQPTRQQRVEQQPPSLAGFVSYLRERYRINVSEQMDEYREQQENRP